MIAADFDANCVNQLYLDIKKTGEPNLQPLVVDLANPSPAIGVNNGERSAFLNRLQADLVLALALIHHLVIGKNIPLPLLASMFQRTGKYVLIEFVPLEDEKVQGMLSQRKNIFAGYTAEAFEAAFEKYFTILKKEKIPGSGRTLYLFIVVINSIKNIISRRPVFLILLPVFLFFTAMLKTGGSCRLGLPRNWQLSIPALPSCREVWGGSFSGI